MYVDNKSKTEGPTQRLDNTTIIKKLNIILILQNQEKGSRKVYTVMKATAFYLLQKYIIQSKTFTNKTMSTMFM